MIHIGRTGPFLLVAVVASPSAVAQSVDCGVDDYRCLEAAHILACRTPPASTLSTCEQWLRQLETHPNNGQPAWRLIAGITYVTLADLDTGTPDEARRLKQQGRNIYRDLVARDPANVQALLGLSSSSDDPEESLGYLRRAVAADPSDKFAVEGLSSNLANSGRPLEAAEVLEQAYSREVGDQRWQLAANALALFRSGGDINRAESLRRRVYEDLDLDDVLEEMSTTRLRNVRRASSVLSKICYVPVVEILGSSTCLDGIALAVSAALEEENSEERTLFAEAMGNAMVSVGRTAALQAEQPTWRSIFRSQIEALLSQDIDSAALYGAYASFVTEPDAHLTALENAAALAPDDGQVLYRLALAYFEQEKWSEAIDQFRAARPLLPPWWRHDVLDQHIQRAEERLRAAQ